MLTKKIRNLSNIVVFVSPCTVHRDTWYKSLGERRKQGLIIRRSDEMKEYGVFAPEERIVIFTQHVRNVKKTLN